MEDTVECRLCWQTDKKDNLLQNMCNCRSDGQPIYEHEKCILAQFSVKTDVSNYRCSVCKCHYNVTSKLKLSKVMWCIFSSCYINVAIVVALKLAVYALLSNKVCASNALVFRVLPALVFILMKLVDDISMCKSRLQLSVTIWAAIVCIFYFHLLDALQQLLLPNVLPALHTGYIMVLSQCKVKHMEAMMCERRLVQCT